MEECKEITIRDLINPHECVPTESWSEGSGGEAIDMISLSIPVMTALYQQGMPIAGKRYAFPSGNHGIDGGNGAASSCNPKTVVTGLI